MDELRRVYESVQQAADAQSQEPHILLGRILGAVETYLATTPSESTGGVRVGEVDDLGLTLRVEGWPHGALVLERHAMTDAMKAIPFGSLYVGAESTGGVWEAGERILIGHLGIVPPEKYGDEAVQHGIAAGHLRWFEPAPPAVRETGERISDRIDRYEDGTLDDVVMTGLFRLEAIDDGLWWVCCYPDVDPEARLSVYFEGTMREEERPEDKTMRGAPRLAAPRVEAREGTERVESVGSIHLRRHTSDFIDPNGGVWDIGEEIAMWFDGDVPLPWPNPDETIVLDLIERPLPPEDASEEGRDDG